MFTAFRARRIIPLAGEVASRSNAELTTHPRILDDAVIVVRGLFVECIEPYHAFRRRTGIPLHDLGNVTLIPGLINAHTHLELSHLHNRTTRGQGFVPWVQSLLPLADETLPYGTLSTILAELRKQGVAHIGDVSSRATKLVANGLYQHDITATLFCERFGYALPDPPASHQLWPDAAQELSPDVFPPQEDNAPLRAVLSGHALFSTHPIALAMAKRWCVRHHRPFSIHLAEHPDEVEFLQTGSGALADALAHRVLPSDFQHPQLSPVAYAAELGLLDERTLAVHCVQCHKPDATILAEEGVWICLCPRSNDYIGVGTAPTQLFRDHAIGLCIGTDSLASNDTLDLWEEARLLRDHHAFSSAALVRMLTINGATALGVDGSHAFGTLDAGKRAVFAIMPDDFSQDL